MYKIRRQQLSKLAQQHAGTFLAQQLSKVAQQAFFESNRDRVCVVGHQGQRAYLVLDGEGRIAQSITPLGRTTQFVHKKGALSSVLSPTGLVTTFDYDEGARVRSITPNAGVPQSIEYDDAGNLAGFRAGTRPVKMAWDADRRLVSTTDRCGQITRRKYDERGCLVEIQDALGRRTSMAYGGWEHPDMVQHPDLAQESFTWRASSFEHAIDGQQQGSFSFSPTGQLLSAEYADGHALAFTYNESGRLTAAESPDAPVSIHYDARGRVIAEHQVGGVVQYRYTADDQLQEIILPDLAQVAFGYDADGRATEVRDFSGHFQRYDFGAGDAPLARQLPNGLSEHHERDVAGTPLALGVKSGERWLWYERYGRDSDGRVSRRSDSRHGERDYSYDAEGRVCTVTPAGSQYHEERYVYDSAGNRTEGAAPITCDLRNRPVRVGSTQYSYCIRGHRIQETSPDGARHYTFNGQGMLTRVELPDGTLVELTYDAFARRVRKKIGKEVTTYVWAGHHLVQEIRESPGQRRTREFAYLPGTHTPIAMRSDGLIYYYHCDHLGTPQVMTDGAGRVVWSARYSAFGSVSIELEEVENPLRFAGQYHDLETGLYYNRARYYDPMTGCYLSIDPAAPVAGTNAYVYAASNPLNVIDPLGLWGEDLPGWVKVTASVLGAVAVGVAVGALVVAALPALGVAAAGSALALGIGLVAGGIAAGTTGAGLNAAMTRDACVPCAMLSGAVGGALGALPFLLALPGMALAGTGALIAAGFVGLGAVGGAIGYIGEWATSQATSDPQIWNTEALLLATGLGAATAGLGRFLGPRIANYRATRAEAAGKPRPQGPYELHPDLKPDPNGVHGYTPPDDSSLRKLKVDFTDPDSVARARAKREPYREGLREKADLARKMKKDGASDEEVARAMVEKRNTGREAAYDPAEVEQVRQRNLKEYGREDGPDYDMLRSGERAPGKERARPKTDQQIIDSATRDNPGMNSLVGLDRPGPSAPVSAAGGAASRPPLADVGGSSKPDDPVCDPEDGL